MTKKKNELEFPQGEHRNCETLTGLTIEHLPRDGSLGRLHRFREHADVWHADDKQDRLYFLRSGQVAIVASDIEGSEVVLRIVETGEPFGELCFCGAHKLRGTIARAVAGSEAVEVKIEDFMDYLQTNADALAALVFTFCIRLADAERRIEILAHRGAEKRLGRLLLHLSTTRGETGDAPAGAITLRVSHDDLAQMAAMSRPQVTLTMNAFRRRGLVMYERNRPLMVDVVSLQTYITGE